MTWVVVWKEWREQAAVVAALLVLGCGLMAGMALLIEPQQRSAGLSAEAFKDIGVIGAGMLALAAGTVIGSTLFAGEREAGTFAFLDRLPGSRGRVWWRKALAGLALAAAPAAAYCVTARLTGLIDGADADGQAALLFAAIVFFGFAWGTVGSVVSRTSLGACATGLAAGFLGSAVLYVAAGVAVAVVRGVLRLPVGERDGVLIGGVAVVFTSLVLPLLVSAFVYTLPDRDRAFGGFASVPTPSGDMKTLRLRVPHLSLASVGVVQRGKRFAWLLARQHRVTVLWVGLTALVAGGLLLIPEAVFVAAWPPLGLVFGVIVGVALFADEQSSEAARFWGERRLRVGGVWSAKMAFGLALTLGLCVVMLLPCFVRGVVEADRQRPFVTSALRTTLFEFSFPAAGFLLLGPVYGLVFGQLAALVFRKAVVAFAVGLMVAGMAASLWLPSLFAGGVHAWQLWTPALVALAVSRLLAWPWATNGLANRGPLLRLAGGLAVVVLAFAVGIVERVREVPVVAEIDDDIKFSKELPSFDETQGGRDVRRAVAEFGTRVKPYLNVRTEPGPATGGGASESQWLVAELGQLLTKSGYPADRPDVDELLAEFDGGEWEKALLDTARKPTGVFIDPNEMTPASEQAVFNTLTDFLHMGRVYLLRGLKAQRDGDPADFVGRLEVTLAVVRTTRTSGPWVAVRFANGLEDTAVQATQRWLEALRGRPELLRRTLAVLADHLRLDTYTPACTALAEQVILRNGLNAPAQWLPQFLDVDGRGSNSSRDTPSRKRAEVESDLVGFMWSVPWERERLRRAVGFNNQPAVLAGVPAEGYLAGTPGLSVVQRIKFFYQSDRTAQARATSRLLSMRAGELQVAVRLFEAETGRFPKTLTELVPKYLPALPLDPYAGIADPPQPLRYRVSPGEVIAVEPADSVTLRVPADPITLAFAQDGPAWDATAPDKAWAVGALAGSAVFWRVDAPMVPADGSGRVLQDASPISTSGASTSLQRRVVLEVAPGQPVVWSVGRDGADSGGTVHVTRDSQNFPTTGDIVFVVPLPAKPPRKSP